MPDQSGELALLRELAQVASDLGPALTPVGHAEMLRSISSAARVLFEAEACSIALLDEAQRELIFHVASGGAEEGILGLRVPIDRGIAGWVVNSGEAIAVDEVARDPRFSREVAEAVGYVPTSILAMPLQTERELLGVIEVLDARAARPGSPRDLELLSVFADQAALAIEGARLFSDLGRAVLAAAAALADGVDLVAALRQVAQQAPEPRAELAGLAAQFAELGRLGPEERAVATRLVEDFLTYLRARQDLR